MAAISGEPSLEEDELSDDALSGIGIDAAGTLGDEDAGGALEGSEELEIARRLLIPYRSIPRLLSNSCELGWTQKTKLN